MQAKKTIYKWFWAWNFEKEENWLNQMADDGWTLDGVGFCRYTFIKSQPGEYVIRMEMNKPERGYLNFMEETGAEYIGRMVQYIYFRKPVEKGSFEIFSDLDSRIEHLNRMGKGIGLIGLANLLIGMGNTLNHSNLGWINLLCATLLMYGLGRIHGKKEALEKERLLHD